MNDPAQMVKDILLQAPALGAFGAASGWSINVGVLPGAPDTVILVNHVGGLDPYPHLLVNQPSVVITVRGAKNGYVAARNKAADIVRRLLGMAPQTLSGDQYQSCIQIGDIAFLGQDDNTRPLFSLNFRFIVLPDSSNPGNRVPIT